MLSFKQEIDNLILGIREMKNVSTKQEIESQLESFLTTSMETLKTIEIPRERIQTIEFAITAILTNMQKANENDINLILADPIKLQELKSDAYLEEHFQLQTQLRQIPTYDTKQDDDIDWDDEPADPAVKSKNIKKRTKIESQIEEKFPPNYLMVANYFGALDSIEKSIRALSNPQEHLRIDSESASASSTSSSDSSDSSVVMDEKWDDDEIDIDAFQAMFTRKNTPSAMSVSSKSSQQDSDEEDWDADLAPKGNSLKFSSQDSAKSPLTGKDSNKSEENTTPVLGTKKGEERKLK